MIINEQLSRGLKNRFFLEIEDRIKSGLKKIGKIQKESKKSSTGWLKMVKLIQQISDQFCITFYEGGSKSSPYIGFVGMAIDSSREYNNWNEKCLSGVAYIQTYTEEFVDICDSPFNIGEHAIARLYERADLNFLNEFEVDLFSILPEFQMVPLWASFWIGNIGTYTESFKKNYSSEYFHPIIPAKSGVFMGELTNVDIPKVEIRTFIHDKNLSDDQLMLKKIMWDLGGGMQSSPLALFPVVGNVKIDSDFFQNQILVKQMIEHHELMMRVLFKNILDDDLRRKLKSDFANFLIKSTKSIDQNFINIYRRLGVRAAQLELKKSVFKSGKGY